MLDPVPGKRMTVAEYLDWAEAQPEGRFELVDGEIIAMAPERTRHVHIKGLAYRALGDAISRVGLDCMAFVDGLMVQIDEHTSRQPDALVQCGVPNDPESTVADNPIIVVEVASPSSAKSDATTKLSEYFSVASIRHYLIIEPVKRVVIHHARREDGDILTRIIRDGEIRLDPPGLIMPFAEMMPELEPPAAD